MSLGDRQRWTRMEYLFQKALDLPIGERVAFVRQHCRDDETLGDELLTLLLAAAEPQAPQPPKLSPHSKPDNSGKA